MISRMSSGAGRRLLIAAMALFVGTSCQDDEQCLSIPHCLSTAPKYATLTVQVSDPAPLVSIYSGSSVETGALTWSGKLSPGSAGMLLPLGTYSIEAVYVVNGDTIHAVDGDELSYSAQETCEGTCYGAVDATVDVRLKITTAKRTARE